MSLSSKTRTIKRAAVTKTYNQLIGENLYDRSVAYRQDLIDKLIRLNKELESLNEKVAIEEWSDDKEEDKLAEELYKVEEYNSILFPPIEMVLTKP